MTFGIYIVGNDPVKENVLALYKSLRFYNPNIAITLIPYSSEYRQITKECSINVFENSELLAKIDKLFIDFFNYPGAPKQANKYPRLRNLAAFWGYYDRFIYLDADIVAFTDMERFSLDLLRGGPFVCYDRTFKHGGKWVFQSEEWPKYYTQSQVARVFNGGFWGSNRELFEYARLVELIEKAKEKRRLFDFPNGALAQPLLNYLVFETIGPDKVHNELLLDREKPEPWAGFRFQKNDNALWSEGYRLPFLHWAGKSLDPSDRYYEIWKFYRSL